MAKTLGGSTFCWNGIKQDYCFKETIICLAELCDEVVVVAGGDDGTPQEVSELIFDLGMLFHKKKFSFIEIFKEDWDAQVGREKLSYFSNIAIDHLRTDWNFYLQCDEILHEDSFPYVRAAIEDPQADGYLVRRFNLWKDPYHFLNVPQERKPCSTEVIRLAKTQYRCVDDAESVAISGNLGVFGNIETIQIFHMGFVRDKVKHLEKIRHMQTEVFLWGDYDVKAKDCSEFQPDRWFDPEKDLLPIPKQLPSFVQQWAQDRYPEGTEQKGQTESR